ncbi:carbohydrate binding family 9 domain-containing protein [Candidatus Aminicenantes bacterium AC-335-L06]|nr:carbohydrate binding family 9 domain-containing protein [Candidatus Aminicenantes bacterium AC-335-L06]
MVEVLRLKKFSLIFVFLIFLIPQLCFSQLNSKDIYTIKIPRLSHKPKIDGVLENPIWEEAVKLENFTQYEPKEGAEPSEKTVAYIGYDSKFLYFAFYCYDSEPNKIRASLTKRDKARGDDFITIYLDTFNDKKRAFVFRINPKGIQSDGIFTESGRGRRRGGWEKIDFNWDTYFLSDGKINKDGYVIEIAVPFKSLRFPNSPVQKWGLQINRTIRRKNEEIYWYPRSRDVNGFLIQSGIIIIDGEIEKGRNFELMPVITALQSDGGKINPEFGTNLKYGITSNLTADLTINPDFSQVESDIPQNEVNQRYAIYYPEKRPFFLEGSDYFSTPINIVYTRKIIDPLWGIKLTGKLGKTTIGFMSSYDENPTRIDIPYMEKDRTGGSEKALINILRLRQDIFSESYIGFSLTDKEMGPSGYLNKNYNRVFGIDGHFKFHKYYRLSFQFLGSQSKVGETKTALAPAFNISLNQSSRHIRFNIEWTSIHPEFEASSGFIRRKDIKSFNTRFGYTFLHEKEYLISITPSISYRRIYDFKNTLTDEVISFFGFLNGWRQSHLWFVFSKAFEKYRGIDFHKKEFRFNFSIEPFKWLNGRVEFSMGDGIYYWGNPPYLGYKVGNEIQAELRPLTNLRIFYKFDSTRFYKRKGGERVYKVNLFTQRINYQISKTLSIRLITDYNSYDRKIYNSFLFSYEYRPGTVFYIGIDDTQVGDEMGVYHRSSRYFFVKFSYWWRF